MSQLLVQVELILAQDVTDNGDNITSSDAIYPKHVIDGWEIVEADVPDGFTCNGYTWNGEEVEQKPPVVLPVEVPQSVTMRQARRALLERGLLDERDLLGEVETAIDSLDSPNKEIARIDWDYSSTVERGRDVVILVGLALGFDSDGLDELFIAAGAIP